MSSKNEDLKTILLDACKCITKADKLRDLPLPSSNSLTHPTDDLTMLSFYVNVQRRIQISRVYYL